MHETRSHAHASGDEEKAGVTRKHKADTRGHEAEQSPKKTKPEQREKSHADSKFANAEFSEFGKAIKDHLSVQQMKEILEANAQETPASADEVVERWLVIFHFAFSVNLGFLSRPILSTDENSIGFRPNTTG